MTTCRTCGCQTDTPALAFLHERMHASLASLGLSEATFVDLERLATLMESYAQQAREAERRKSNELIGQAFLDGKREGTEARNREVAEVLRLFHNDFNPRYTIEEIAHRLGLTTEPQPAAEAEESRQC
jgi:DNA invertase Pin-like site-specific DNA recombinase